MKKTVFCTNCYYEWNPDELNLKFSEVSSEIIAYCSHCNYTEFMSSDEYLQLSDAELKETEEKSDNHKTFSINKYKIIHEGVY